MNTTITLSSTILCEQPMTIDKSLLMKCLGKVENQQKILDINKKIMVYKTIIPRKPFKGTFNVPFIDVKPGSSTVEISYCFLSGFLFLRISIQHQENLDFLNLFVRFAYYKITNSPGTYIIRIFSRFVNQ